MSWFFSGQRAGCAPCCSQDELRVDDNKGNLVQKQQYEAYRYPPQLPAAASTAGSSTIETFDVLLEGGAHIEEIGLEVSLTDMTVLRIDGILSGRLADRWNESCVSSQKLVMGDRIVGINGQRADGPALKNYIKQGSCHTITIQHAEHLFVEVEKKGRKVGLGLGFCKKEWCAYLEVETLNEGIFTDWNAMQAGEGALTVQGGDRIVEVNGFRGSPQELLARIARNDALQLEIVKKAWRNSLR